jgi:hypothetical protein
LDQGGALQFADFLLDDPDIANDFGASYSISVTAAHGTLRFTSPSTLSSLSLAPVRRPRRSAGQLARVCMCDALPVVEQTDSPQTISWIISPPEAQESFSHLQYTAPLDFTGVDTVRFTVSDRGASGTGGPQTTAEDLRVQVLRRSVAAEKFLILLFSHR